MDYNKFVDFTKRHWLIISSIIIGTIFVLAYFLGIFTGIYQDISGIIGIIFYLLAFNQPEVKIIFNIHNKTVNYYGLKQNKRTTLSESLEDQKIVLDSQERIMVGILGEAQGTLSIDEISNKLVDKFFDNVFLNIKLVNTNTAYNYTYSEYPRPKSILLDEIPNWDESRAKKIKMLQDLESQYMPSQKWFWYTHIEKVTYTLNALFKKDIILMGSNRYSLKPEFNTIWKKDRESIKSYIIKNPLSNEKAINDLIFYGLDNFAITKRNDAFHRYSEKERDYSAKRKYEIDVYDQKFKNMKNWEKFEAMRESWNTPRLYLKRTTPLEKELKKYYPNEIGKPGLSMKLLIPSNEHIQWLLQTVLDEAKDNKELTSEDKMRLLMQIRNM